MCNGTKLSCTWKKAKIYENGNGLVDPLHLVPASPQKPNTINSAEILRQEGGGHYFVRCNTSVPDVKGAVAEDFGFLNILEPQVVSDIVGPKTVLHVSGQVVLSAAGSYDAVERERGPRGLTFRWRCRRDGDDTFVEVKNTSGCSGSPRFPSASHNDLVLDPETMEPGITYVFQVDVTKLRKFKDIATHKLKVEKFASIMWVRTPEHVHVLQAILKDVFQKNKKCCIYSAPFPYEYAALQWSVYPQRTKAHIGASGSRFNAVHVCWYSFYRARKDGNLSEIQWKEGHTDIQPSTRPGIELGTFLPLRQLLRYFGKKPSLLYYFMQFPVWFFSCRENCYPKTATSRPTVIAVQYHRESYKSDTLRYDWFLYVLRGHRWLNETNHLNEMVPGGIDGPKLVFPGRDPLTGNEARKPLANGVQYKVTVKMHIKGGSVFKDELFFFTDTPPNSTSLDKCIVEPPVGFTLETEYIISCSGWHDEELPLTYEFRYRSNTSIVVIQRGPEQRLRVILPSGNAEKDYNFTLEISVTDAIGSSTIHPITFKVRCWLVQRIPGKRSNAAYLFICVFIHLLIFRQYGVSFGMLRVIRRVKIKYFNNLISLPTLRVRYAKRTDREAKPLCLGHHRDRLPPRQCTIYTYREALLLSL